MSAFVVSPEHIRELVAFAVSRKYYGDVLRVDPRYLYGVSEELKDQLKTAYTDTDIATIYAGVLYSENLRSVWHRYPDDESIENLPGLINKPSSITITTKDIAYRKVTNLVHILKMCACLEYQSCETEDWEKTDAFQLLQAIKDAAINALPGYDNAPWDYCDCGKETPASV